MSQQCALLVLLVRYWQVLKLQHYYTQIKRHSSSQGLSSLSLQLLLSLLLLLYFFSDAVKMIARMKNKCKSKYVPSQRVQTSGCNNNNNSNSSNIILIIVCTENSLQSIQSKLPKLSWHSGNSRGSIVGCAFVCFFECVCMSHLVSYCTNSVRRVRRCSESHLETFQRSLWGVWWGQRSVISLAAQAEALWLTPTGTTDQRDIVWALNSFHSVSLEFCEVASLWNGWGVWLS